MSVDDPKRTSATWLPNKNPDDPGVSCSYLLLEYLYVDLGNFTYGQAGTLGDNAKSSERFNLVRAGINYRFGGPLVASYCRMQQQRRS